MNDRVTSRARIAAMLIASIAVATTAAPARVHACSLAAAGFDVLPNDGETQVPTDVVPIYLPPASDLEALQASLTASDGTAIATTRRSLDTFVELVPAHELAPNTAFTLTLTRPSTGEVVSQTQFTTGGGKLALSSSAPAVHEDTFRLKPKTDTSCQLPSGGTCVSIAEHDTVLTGSYLDANGGRFDSLALMGSSFFSKWPGLCVAVRVRALNGELSAPVTACDRDLPILQLGEVSDLSCTPQGLLVDGKPLGSGAGCSVTSGARRAHGAASALAFGSLALIAVGVRKRASATRQRRARRG